MSNIWHKAGFHEAIDDKLKVSKDGKWVYWTMYGWNIAGEDAHDIGCEWCYLDDLLALETELDRTRKALDVAVDALKEYADRDNWGMGFAPWLEDGFNDALYTENGYKTAEKTLEQITALEQKD